MLKNCKDLSFFAMMLSSQGALKPVAFLSSFSILFSLSLIGLHLKKNLSLYSNFWHWKQIATYFSVPCPKSLAKDAPMISFGIFILLIIRGKSKMSSWHQQKQFYERTSSKDQNFWKIYIAIGIQETWFTLVGLTANASCHHQSLLASASK